MESFVLFLLLLFYVFLRVAFGKVKDKTADDRVRYRPGLELVKQKQYDQAVAYFEKVIGKDDHCALAYAMRGKCRLAQGDPIEAIVDCNRATSFDHCLAEAYLDKGIALFRLKHVTEAYLEFDKAVWYGKDNAEAYRWRGILRMQLGMDEKARQDLEKAIRLGDEHASYYLLHKGGNRNLIEKK
jgi:tetratricopeptide (TPR) repeat protein